MNKIYDVAIIGGGASGIISAIQASKKGKKVIVIEQKNRILKKVLVTGNGQCNFTNNNATSDNYYSISSDKLAKEIIQSLFQKYGVEKIKSFFEEIGVLNIENKKGRVYPLSFQASSVVDSLRYYLEFLNVDLMLETECISFSKNDIFNIKLQNENIFSIKASNLVIATGGITHLDCNNSNSVFFVTNSTKHTRTKLFPILVQLKTNKEYILGLEGVKIDARVSLVYEDRIIKTIEDELLFTSYGISGPSIFSLSHYLAIYDIQKVKFIINFVPEYEKEVLKKVLINKRNKLKYLTLDNYFIGILNKKLGSFLIKRLGYKLNQTVDILTDKDISQLINDIYEYEIKVEDTMGFKNAQVMAGGIPLTEINKDTLESKYIKNLYFTGEILDLFGECGGYNLQWCWSSGMLVGDNIE